MGRYALFFIGRVAARAASDGGDDGGEPGNDAAACARALAAHDVRGVRALVGADAHAMARDAPPTAAAAVNRLDRRAATRVVDPPGFDPRAGGRAVRRLARPRVLHVARVLGLAARASRVARVPGLATRALTRRPRRASRARTPRASRVGDHAKGVMATHAATARA